MKLKLDENLGSRGKQLFINAGYDVATVTEQNLEGAVDSKLITVCKKEKRCLVTLDLDFSNPLNYKPSDYTGIAVLRLPKQPNHQDLMEAIATLIQALKNDDITGRLWIVQRGIIRIYQEDND